MSLNNVEQMVFDYVQRHPEERHYWVAKVREAAHRVSDDHAAAALLDTDLWRYFEERAAVAEPFREFVRHHGARRTSMRNLAEYLLRVWVPPRPKPARSEDFGQ